VMNPSVARRTKGSRLHRTSLAGTGVTTETLTLRGTWSKKPSDKQKLRLDESSRSSVVTLRLLGLRLCLLHRRCYQPPDVEHLHREKLRGYCENVFVSEGNFRCPSFPHFWQPRAPPSGPVILYKSKSEGVIFVDF
jgi:hypothetical protein